MPFSVTSGRRMIWCGSRMIVVVCGTCTWHGYWFRQSSLAVRLRLGSGFGLRGLCFLAAATSASSAALVTNTRRDASTLRAFSSAAGDTVTPAMLRALLYTLTS